MLPPSWEVEVAGTVPTSRRPDLSRSSECCHASGHMMLGGVSLYVVRPLILLRLPTPLGRGGEQCPIWSRPRLHQFIEPPVCPGKDPSRRPQPGLVAQLGQRVVATPGQLAGN